MPFFQNASNVYAQDGTFNDVTGDQFNGIPIRPPQQSYGNTNFGNFHHPVPAFAPPTRNVPRAPNGYAGPGPIAALSAVDTRTRISSQQQSTSPVSTHSSMTYNTNNHAPARHPSSDFDKDARAVSAPAANGAHRTNGHVINERATPLRHSVPAPDTGARVSSPLSSPHSQPPYNTPNNIAAPASQPDFSRNTNTSARPLPKPSESTSSVSAPQLSYGVGAAHAYNPAQAKDSNMYHEASNDKFSSTPQDKIKTRKRDKVKAFLHIKAK